MISWLYYGKSEYNSAAIESLLIKERLDLPLRLRELDEKVEKVELRAASAG